MVAGVVRVGRLRARLLFPVERSPIDWQSNSIIIFHTQLVKVEKVKKKNNKTTKRK